MFRQDEYQLLQSANIRLLYFHRNEPGSEELRKAIIRNVGFLREYNEAKAVKEGRKIFLGKNEARRKFLDVFA